MQSHHGSGAVIVSSQKTGSVNFGVSRESGGAVRALRNAGDKHVKRERGNRSVAAIAVRFERGYLKRTAGGTACVNNHGDCRRTRGDGNGHPTARDGDDGTRTRKRKTRTASAEHGEHAKTARAGRSSRHRGDRKARTVRWRSVQVSEFIIRSEIVPRSRGPAVSRSFDEDRIIVDTETQPNLRSEGSALSTQMYYILVMTTAGAALDKCHNARRERRVRGLQTVRDGMGAQTSDEVCGTLDERAGYRFLDNIPTKLAAFERTVHDFENQSTKTVDDDIKIGVTMLGMEDMRVEEHLIWNSVRITSWNQMREEQQGQRQQCKERVAQERQGQREERQRQRQGHQGQRHGQGCEKRIVQESEKRRSEKVLLLQQNRPLEGRVQQATERPP